jgi:hypothetical protein
LGLQSQEELVSELAMVSVTALGWRLVSVWEWEFELVLELAMVSVTALEWESE